MAPATPKDRRRDHIAWDGSSMNRVARAWKRHDERTRAARREALEMDEAWAEADAVINSVNPADVARAIAKAVARREHEIEAAWYLLATNGCGCGWKRCHDCGSPDDWT